MEQGMRLGDVRRSGVHARHTCLQLQCSCASKLRQVSIVYLAAKAIMFSC